MGKPKNPGSRTQKVDTMDITSEKVEFTGHDGKSTLAAHLDKPDGRKLLESLAHGRP